MGDRFEAALDVRGLHARVRLHGLDQRCAVGAGRQAKVQANRREFALRLAVHALQHGAVFGGGVEKIVHARRLDLDLEQEMVRLDAMPIAAEIQTAAAVVRPRTAMPWWMIAPAPRKPTPVTTCAATRVGSIGAPERENSEKP